MTKDEVIKLGEEAMSRDPRTSPYGYFSGGSFVLDSVRVFMWFSSIRELIDHISESDPIVHDLDDQEARTFAAAVRAVFGDNQKLTDENRKRVNQASREFLCIDWWGTFDELTHGNSDLAREMRSSFRDDGSESPIRSAEMDDFVELVHNYGF